MQHITLVFPHQLFAQHPALEASRPVYLIEERLFFRQYRFHQQKLVLHRASMQYYCHWLQQQGYKVTYIPAADDHSDIRKLIPHLAGMGVKQVQVAELVDDWLQRRLQQACQKHGIKTAELPAPGFLNSTEQLNRYMQGRRTYFQTDFYTWQRKQRNILLDIAGKPVGGKWSFDAENRQRFPAGERVPVLPQMQHNAFVQEACQYVATHFAGNPGALHPVFAGVVVTHADAAQWLQNFVSHRLAQFGVYEDAMVIRETVLHHSVLTPMLNIGLLTPQQVLDAVLAAGAEVPINSREGFVRQVLGWREFIRMMYEREGRRQRTANFWGFRRRIPESFYTATTGIVPVDTVIRRVLQTGYCHHIERLMVLGNFMLLCEFDPGEVYRWFMELFIDAYDWVMVPNVYGMSQFADGGLMCTKPYISGSNYIMKMSDFEKGPWQQVWDGLFWRFMHVHRSFFTQNPRLGMLVGTFDKMKPEKKQAHLNIATSFLDKMNDL